jgi:DNA-binding LytR/AlgR family response regulator
MEDHYVRIHTPTGSRLELMSMSQAIAALGGVEGRRVHRSWWVARAAVEAAEPDGRNWRLKLRGGLRAPVSRANVAPLRAAGWLPPAVD